MGQQLKPSADEKQLVTLGRVLQTLREEENVDVLIETTLNYIQTEMRYDLVWIGFYDRLDHRILGKGGFTPTGDITFLKNRFFLNPGDLLEQVVIQQRPIGVPDLQEATRAGEWRRAAQNFNIRGTLLFPIRYRDRCFGVLLAGSKQWGVSPRSEEKARLSMLLGGLGAALNQIETDWLKQQTKRPDEPLLKLLDRLRSLPSTLQRLDALVAQTHQFIQSSRTNIYWFEPERRYFWRRIGNRSGTSSFGETTSASGITVQEAGGFYKAMVADQIVSIGEAHSSLKADVTSRLLQRLGVRSLLAAPIIMQDELLGFLAVEGNDPRIWKEEEKNYIRGAAQLIALIAPIEEMEKTIEQTKQDAKLQSDIVRAITSDDDWQQTMKTCADTLLHRLQAQRFLVLLFDADADRFEICYQSHPANRRPLGTELGKRMKDVETRLIASVQANDHSRTDAGISLVSTSKETLSTLSEVDWQLVERSAEAVEIEDLTADLRLLAWREVFLEAGIRSLLIISTSVGRPLEGILALGSESPRTWTMPERDMLRATGQQLGLILHQWQLQRHLLQQQKTQEFLQWGLTTLLNAQTVDALSFEEHAHDIALAGPIAQLLDCPLIALVTWSPGRQTCSIVPAVVTSSEFAVNPDIEVRVSADALIQEALSTDGLLCKSIDDLPPNTRQWLCGSEIGTLLVMALRTAPEHQPTGIVVVADRRARVWPQSMLPIFSLFVKEMAWFRRQAMLTAALLSQRRDLECLNWYKHRLFTEFHRSVEAGVKSLSQVTENLASKPSSQKDVDIGVTRIKQILSALGNSLSSMTRAELTSEWWKKSHQSDSSVVPGETFSLTSLLRRSLDRVEPLIKQRRLWSQVHDASTSHPIPGQLTVRGDLLKIELVLHEVLLTACSRAPEGGRIDLWYRLLQQNKDVTSERIKDEMESEWQLFFLELSITDNGVIDPQLITELQTDGNLDELAPSTLSHPPGLSLRICQSIMLEINGELKLYQMEDGRVLSRLLIPLQESYS